jgi:hypothetical protein
MYSPTEQIHVRFLVNGSSDELGWQWHYQKIFYRDLIELVDEGTKRGHSFFAWRRMGLANAGRWTFIDPSLEIGPETDDIPRASRRNPFISRTAR